MSQCNNPHNLDEVTAEIGRRISLWLSETWPRHTVKEAARAFGVSRVTAERWKSGLLPENKHIVAMVQRWGARFLASIYGHIVGGDGLDAAALAAELSELRAAFARIDARSRLGVNDCAMIPVASDMAGIPDQATRGIVLARAYTRVRTHEAEAA